MYRLEEEPYTFSFRNEEGSKIFLDGTIYFLKEATTVNGHQLQSGSKYNAKFIDMDNKNIIAILQNKNGYKGLKIIIGVE